MMKEFGIPESKITVTPLGINPAYGVSLPSNGKELQTQGRSIVASTAHDPRKNIASVIQGYCLLRQHYPQTADVLLHLVGRQGKWKKEFLSMLPLVYRSSIHIHHNLTYDQLAALTRDASVFVYPSFYEGFGLPLLEAMAMGTPVITSPNSAIIETAGDSAYYTDPYNPYAMAKAFGAVLSNLTLRTSLSQKGKKRVAQYTWDATATKTIEVLQQVAITPPTL